MTPETPALRAEQRNAQTNDLLRIVAIIALIFLMVCGVTTVVLQVLQNREAGRERDLIDERNIEVTIIIGECLTKYRNEDLRTCVNRFLPPDGLKGPRVTTTTTLPRVPL